VRKLTHFSAAIRAGAPIEVQTLNILYSVEYGELTTRRLDVGLNRLSCPSALTTFEVRCANQT
jgi:hypothetical protein